MEKYPKVGFGVYILKGNKVLLGKRKNSHGAGEWCFAGGHLEFNETWEECAEREIAEEIGINVKNVHFSGVVTNDFFKEEDKHYITLYMICDYDTGDVKVLEPEKSECWEWFSWDNLPEPLFIPIQNLRKTGFNPFKK
jgi:8-oxo-dGTP diphosphatase